MRDTMQVIVTGRQGGKTSAIVDWLLEGHSIAPYPGWSRVIPVSYTHLTLPTTERV